MPANVAKDTRCIGLCFAAAYERMYPFKTMPIRGFDRGNNPFKGNAQRFALSGKHNSHLRDPSAYYGGLINRWTEARAEDLGYEKDLI